MKDRITLTDRVRESKAICARLAQIIPSGGVILAFEPLPDEPDIEEIIERLRLDYRLALVDGEGDTARVVLSSGPIIMGLIPGRAFDRAGRRLGRGGGSFDRILTHADYPLIGVAFDCQIVKQVPTEEHDVLMHEIVTASERIIVGGKA